MTGPWGFATETFWLLVVMVILGLIPLFIYLNDLRKPEPPEPKEQPEPKEEGE